jgi:hypothetical protein
MGLQEYLIVYGKARITEGGTAVAIKILSPWWGGDSTRTSPPFKRALTMTDAFGVIHTRATGDVARS